MKIKQKSILNFRSNNNMENVETIQNMIQETTMPTLPNINQLQTNGNDNDYLFITDQLDYEMLQEDQQTNNNLIQELTDNKDRVSSTQLDSNANRNNININMRLKKKVMPSALEKQKKLFNKLYGIDTFYLDNCTKAKRTKYLSLEQYQTNILNLLARQKIDQQHFINLNNKLKDIRYDAELVSPLPPINFAAIHENAKSHNLKKVKVRKMGYKEYIASLHNKSIDNDDDFNKIKFKYRTKAKPYNNKVFNNLPAYLLETIQKKMKLHL